MILEASWALEAAAQYAKEDGISPLENMEQIHDFFPAENNRYIKLVIKLNNSDYERIFVNNGSYPSVLM